MYRTYCIHKELIVTSIEFRFYLYTLVLAEIGEFVRVFEIWRDAKNLNFATPHPYQIVPHGSISKKKTLRWKGTENSRPGNSEGNGMENMTGKIIEIMIPDRITTGKHLSFISQRGGYLVPVIGGPRCFSLAFFANHKTLRYIGVLRVSNK